MNHRFIPIKEYLCSLCIGKTISVKCDCPVVLNEDGIVKSYKVSNNDIILYVERLRDKKIIPITLNQPHLLIKEF